MADYSKWDAMAREEEAAEQREKELKRAQNRQKYYKEQEEKKSRYQAEQEAKQKSGSASHSHDGHSHGDHSGHSHGGDHSDDGAIPAGKQPLLTAPRRPACGCGYADVEEMKRAAEEAAREPQLTPAEKNARKIAAVHATREHGRELFQAGQYKEAFAVYERGVLIITGIFGVEPDVQEELTKMEVMLDLNMAMCQLKLCEWTNALDQCRMALQLDPTSVKAHYRMAQAHVGMANWEEARAHLKQCTTHDKQGTSKREIAALMAEIRRKEAEEREKQIRYAKQLEAKLAQSKQAFSSPAEASPEPHSQQPQQAAVHQPSATTAEGSAAESAADADADPDIASLAHCMREAQLQPQQATEL